MQPLARETEVLLLCARQRMSEPAAARVRALCGAPSFRWGALHRAAVFHQIAGLVLTNLLKIDAAAERMPPAVRERWKHSRTRNILVKKKRAKTLSQIVELLSRRSIRVMLVKGAALDAAVYEEPWYIQSDDVDAFADIPFGDLNERDRSIVWAMVRGSGIELEFTRHHDLDMNGVLDIDYARLWAEARSLAYGKERVYLMSPEDMLLSTCINLCRKRYVQLKGMVAVRELIDAYPDLDWEKLVQSALACGASRIVYAALTVTAKALGCPVPARALEGLRVGCTRRWAIDGLSHAIHGYLVQVPAPQREPATRLFASGLLRVASYRLPQFWREVRVYKKLRRYLKQRAEEAAIAERVPNHLIPALSRTAK